MKKHSSLLIEYKPKINEYFQGTFLTQRQFLNFSKKVNNKKAYLIVLFQELQISIMRGVCHDSK